MKVRFLSCVATLVAILTSSATYADDVPSSIFPLDTVAFSPAFPGVEIAVLSGNPQVGPATFLLRFAPGFPGSMHWHDAGYTGVVLQGATKHWDRGQTADDVPLLEVGDSWVQPGDAAHQDSNPTDEPAVIFISMDGPLNSEQAD